jgi:hypothetical protein
MTNEFVQRGERLLDKDSADTPNEDKVERIIRVVQGYENSLTFLDRLTFTTRRRSPIQF